MEPISSQRSEEIKAKYLYSRIQIFKYKLISKAETIAHK